MRRYMVWEQTEICDQWLGHKVEIKRYKMTADYIIRHSS
jgi:hypothetical protein